MKNYLPLVLLCTLAILQSCGTKNSETENASDVNSTVVAEDAAQRSERLEKARIEKQEQRRLAAIEQAKIAPTFTDASGKVVYNKAEVDPSFIGGDKEIGKYLRENLIYPEEAKEEGLEGTVFVDFIIDEKGAVREATASETLGDGIDQSFKDEALRVVNAMPAWTPGLQRGVAVNTRFSIPITFRLSN